MEWRSHPALSGRFHPDAPDDVPVAVHDGGPRVGTSVPEVVWVRVTGIEANSVFRGAVLNAPQQLKGVERGSVIRFVAPAGEHLLMVTDQYLAERDAWSIGPCSECGLDELFDPPSVLMRATFPDLDEAEQVEAFTALCGLCGGNQVVMLRDPNLEAPMEATPKKWWQVWR